MKKCISCGQEIDDGAVFCKYCGTKQEGEAKKQFAITSRAFCRIFRPSFFGGFQASKDTLLKFIAGFLSLSRELSENETAEINRAFDMLLNNASEEYQLSESRGKYALSEEHFGKVDSEKFRYNFVSDSLIRTVEQYYKSSGAVGTKHFGNVWLFALLCALDGNYSDEKQMFFARLKNLYPVSRDDFLSAIAPQKNRYNDSEDLYYTVKRLLGYIPGMEKAKIVVQNYYYGSFYFELDGNKTETTVDEFKKLFPTDFDFYGIVEEKIKALCEAEYQILTLEDSEGKYSEIADKIAELSRSERELTNDLAGFSYMKF
jgi:hypothetical protein